VSGEVRILRDHGGVLGDIVDSLHDVTRQLRDVPHALVGGVAVLVHVQGHRITEALVAMKTVSMADPKRGDKSATDLLDLWRLLSDDPIGTVAILQELRGAPERLRLWVQERITALFDEDPGGFVARMASAPGAARSVEDVRDLWDAVVGPTLA
jgi:hypothetical protein